MDGENSATYNMAKDLALLEKCQVPVLRLYSWSPSAVSIGRFQSLNDEVDVQKCKEKKVSVVRRVTGGGAVFHDAEVTYSVCIPVQENLVSTDITKSYKEICGAVMRGLKILGVNPTYEPINDICISGKKVSGCAQTRKNGILLQHGTILMKVDPEKMFQMLRVPQEKMRDKIVKSVKERVTALSDMLQREVMKAEVIDALVKGFGEWFEVSWEKSDLTDEEREVLEKRKREVFENEEWTRLR